jgi:branched-subunit amino acid transport protein
MSGYAAMFLLGGACWIFRVLFIAVIPAHRLPTAVTRALRHLAPSVLSALVAVETASNARAGSPVLGVCVIGAVVLMGLVAWRTRSLLCTIGVGSALALVLDLGVLSL